MCKKVGVTEYIFVFTGECLMIVLVTSEIKKTSQKTYKNETFKTI